MPTLCPLQPTQPQELFENSGEGNGLEAWRRLHSEYEPTSSMRRVAILQQVQNPPRCQRVEDLGAPLEDWLSKKRQYEMFTDRHGRPCQASDDSLVAAMFRLMPKSLEETVIFANEDEGFQELYDRLLAYSSMKQSIQMSENKTTRMDVDALSKGSGKGKSKGKGKKGKGQNHMSNVRCWNCGKTGHYARNCSEMSWSRGKDKGKAQGDEHADGWTWSGEQSDAWWKTTDWKTGPGSRWWTTANDWTPWEEPMGQIEINSMERCWIENPRRGGKQRTSGSATSSASGTSESGRRRMRTPTPRPSPTPKPSEGSVTGEWSETSVSSVGSYEEFLRDEEFFDDQSKEHHHEGANLDQSCRSARSCFQETLHDECVIVIREEPGLHVEHQGEVNRNWKSEARPAGRGEWLFEDGSMRVDAQRTDQCLKRFRNLLEDADRDCEQDGPSDREESLPLEFQWMM